MRQPSKGDVARCSKGSLGLITNSEKQHVIYEKCLICARGRIHLTTEVLPVCERCVTGEAYVGIHLTDLIAPVGSPWSSRTPVVIGSLDDIISSREWSWA